MKKLNKEQRAQLAVSIMDLEDSDFRKLTEEAAQKYKNHFSDLWQYVIWEKEKREKKEIPDDFDLEQLADDDFCREFFRKFETSKLDLWNRFINISGNKISSNTLEKLLLSKYGRYCGDLVYNESISEAFLIKLLHKKMYVTAIAHRGGPQSVLEESMKFYDSTEPLITLFEYYYCEDSYPIEEFKNKLEEHKEMISTFKFKLHVEKYCSPEKLKILEDFLGEKN